MIANRIWVGIFLVLGAMGCDSRSAPPPPIALVDPAVSRVESLGWLGADVQPITATLTIGDEGSALSVGGVLVSKVIADAPLAKAGLEKGDAIVRVGEAWVPVMDRPTAEILRLVEQAVSSGEKTVAISRWKRGEVSTVDLIIDRPALEVGLPVEVERFRLGASAAVERLIAMQAEDGGFGDGVPASVEALAGIAVLSAARGESAVLGKLTDHLEKSETDSAVELTYTLMFLCERLGPLPAEVQVAAGGARAPSGSALPHPGPPGGGHSMTPEQLQKMLKQLGGDKVSIEMSFSGPDGAGPPPGLEIPEGATIVGADQLALPEETDSPGGSGPGLRELLEKHEPARIPAIESLDGWVARLISAADEDGAWGEAERLGDDRFLLTCYALVALGMAQRVGAEVPEEALDRALDVLRPMIADGKLAAEVARGADRRIEAGRAAHAAWALRVLDCPDRNDEFFDLVSEYSDSVGGDIVASPTGVPLHLLATGAFRRSRGLARWQGFYDDFRLLLVGAQHPDGSFGTALSRDPGPLEAALAPSDAPLAGEVFATAIGTIVLSLQSEQVPVMLARAGNPFAPQTTSEGERIERASAMPTPVLPVLKGGPTIMADPERLRKLLDPNGDDR